MHYSRIQQFLKEQKIDGLYITNKTNIRYWSNFVGTNGTLVFTKKRGYLITDSRYLLEAEDVLPREIGLVDVSKLDKFFKKMRLRRIGFEGQDISVGRFSHFKKYFNKTRFEDISQPFNALRMVKMPHELSALHHAQKITDQIFSILKKKLRPGMSERHIGWMVESLAHDHGAEDISFPAIVGFNEHSAEPHHHNTDLKLKRGDLILIDMGVIYKGYCSDMTRVLFTGKPTDLEQKIYTTVWNAQEKGIREIRPGMSGNEADAISRRIIEKAGYGKYFGHSLGHGVGLDIHELPNLSPVKSKKIIVKIPQGTVVTVEPGIYLPGKFGVRLEDMILVGEKKNTNLTKSPKDILEVTIRI